MTAKDDLAEKYSRFARALIDSEPSVAYVHPSVLEGFYGPDWREIAKEQGWELVNGVWTKDTQA